MSYIGNAYGCVFTGFVFQFGDLFPDKLSCQLHVTHVDVEGETNGSSIHLKNSTDLEEKRVDVRIQDVPQIRVESMLSYFLYNTSNKIAFFDKMMVYSVKFYFTDFQISVSAYQS